ncbi:hypothetical protein Ocin01_08594 [Orchesella cincta]|uniref:Uncharacterized protein n=1 Tax=Orchesella cincta TaxID=48709 RepID=A0A1D2MYG8_ORCCI|nr:hypothetical protein Ocin01_08594 [Orchesella cincta]
MQKSLFILFVATYVAVCCARSSKPVSIFQKISEEDVSQNEIRTDFSELAEEKQNALMTNEIQVTARLSKNDKDDDNSQGETDNIEEEDDNDTESNEYANDQAVEISPASSQFINPSKAPSSPLEYIMDLFYGFFSWIHDKFTT